MQSSHAVYRLWRHAFIIAMLLGIALSACRQFALRPGRQTRMHGVDDFRFTRREREQAVTSPGAYRAAEFLEGK